MVLHRETLELAPLMEAVAGVYECIAQERDVRLQIQVPPSLQVTVDPVRLQQVVSNLLDNAIKYSAAGGLVSVSAGRKEAPEGARTWLTVQDNGGGISAHDLPRIWDRLYRGDYSRTTRGSGLGLSLVKAIVEAHGGRAEVSSKPNAGSAFTVLLPSN